MRARPAVTQRDMECDADTVVLMDHFNTSTMQREREREREIFGLIKYNRTALVGILYLLEH